MTGLASVTRPDSAATLVADIAEDVRAIASEPAIEHFLICGYSCGGPRARPVQLPDGLVRTAVLAGLTTRHPCLYWYGDMAETNTYELGVAEPVKIFWTLSC